MRTKEEAHDYRYFPDPDLMPVMISEELKAQIKAELPEVPFERQRRYMSDYGLPYSATSVLCHDIELCSFFEESLKTYSKNPKGTANLITNDLLREIYSKSESEEDSSDDFESVSEEAVKPSHQSKLAECKVTPENLALLVKLGDDGVISKQMAKEVFAEMFSSGKNPESIVEEKGLRQNSDGGELEKFCIEAMSKNQKAIDQYKAGNAKAINALIGPVMKASGGKANPAMVLEIMKRLIG